MADDIARRVLIVVTMLQAPIPAQRSSPDAVPQTRRILSAIVAGDFALGPAWVAGNSFGASITLRLAGEHSDLLRGIIAHEPPLFSLLANDPSVAPMLDEVGKRIAAVVERIASGDDAGAARQFVETVALGPGSWDQLSPDLKETFITNAPTFLDEAHDPEQLAFDLAWIGAFDRPALLTTGDKSPPTFAPVVERVASVLPNASVAAFAGAGHIPHVTHPDAYVEAIRDFIRCFGPHVITDTRSGRGCLGSCAAALLKFRTEVVDRSHGIERTLR